MTCVPCCWNPPGGEWYTTISDGTIDDPLTLTPQSGPLAETDYLPDPGFLIEDAPPVDAADLRRALERCPVASLTGQAEWASRCSGDWGLRIAAGLESGKTAAGNAARDGRQIGKSYHFHCAIISESDEFWRDRPTCYRSNYESVQQRTPG